MKKWVIFPVIWACCILSLSSQQIIWPKGAEQVNIAPDIGILEDKNEGYSLEQVIGDSLHQKFKSSGNIILNFGFTTSTYWMHFSLNNPGEKLLLELAHTHLENVTFYAVDTSGKITSMKSGYSIPIKEKYKNHHFQIFPLLPGPADYYVHISQPVQPLPVRIHAESSYDVTSYRQRLVFGFYLGLIFFVILSNLFFYISMRSKLFLFYSGIVLVYLSYASMVMDGFIVYFIDDVNLHFWYKNIPTLGVPLQMMYALVFLEMSRYSPRLNKYTWWLIYYFVAYAILKFWMPPTTLFALNTLHALISFFGMFYLGFKAGKKGNRLGYYFAMAYLIYFVLVLIEATYVQIGTPGYFMELSHVAWATLIEAFILSFLLSKRFEWEREESEKQKNEAQSQLLEKTLENEKIVREQNVYLENRVEERTNELKKSLENLQLTQDKLIQSEKLASLGELTAGIAHEIKNPLNFVNNFAEVTTELADELIENMEKGEMEEAKALSKDIKHNAEKISEHGKRADSIVRGMLQHSRGGSLQKESTDINVLCEEYVRLAYHGFRAKDNRFSAGYELNLDSGIPKVMVVMQDMGRIVLNLINNAFYAVNDKAKEQGEGYKPMITVSTRQDSDFVYVEVADNGPGIPDHILGKIFQPFYTTKPTGQGTGLGLSLAYDMVKAHGGELDVRSNHGENTVFTIKIPKS